MDNKNNPATKQDVQDILEAVNQGFNEQAKIIATMATKEDFEESKKEILESNEKIAKKIDDMRQEQVAHQGGHKRVNDTLLDHGNKMQNHKKRITKLELLPQEA